MRKIYKHTISGREYILLEVLTNKVKLKSTLTGNIHFRPVKDFQKFYKLKEVKNGNK